MFVLRTLGSLDLHGSSEAPAPLLHEPVRLAVVLYLAACRNGFAQRDRLTALLWPDSRSAHARNALRQAVHRIRTVLGAEALESAGNGDLTLLHPEVVDADTLRLRRAVAEGRDEEVLRLYRGTFLPDFTLPGRPEFADWITAKRVEFRTLARESAVRLAERAEEGGDWCAAGRLWERAALLSWYDEDLLRRWMRALVEAGSPAEALNTYRRAGATLRREMGMELDARTQALAREIRERGPPR